MFARTAKETFVCLRCQHHLTHKIPSCFSSAFIATPSSRRWQATAVAEVDYDDEPHHESRDDSFIRPSEPSKRTRRFDRPKIKHWRPSSTAKLGVNSLGNPAEVLLLPSRDRIIPQVPQDDEPKQADDGYLQESLDSEKSPLSVEKLKGNINQVRLQAGQDNGVLDTATWRRMKRSLSKGFTRAQLLLYVETYEQEHSIIGKLSDMLKTSEPKALIAELLIQELWGFTTPSLDTEVTQKDKVTIIGCAHQYAAMQTVLLDPAQPLREVAETWNVKVDVFREHKKIQLTGKPQSVEAADVDVREMLKSVNYKLLSVVTPLGLQLKEHRLGQVKVALTQYLENKYSVHIRAVKMGEDAKQGISLHVYYLPDHEHKVDEIKREIVAAAKEQPSLDRAYSIWPAPREGDPLVAPAYPFTEPRVFPETDKWARYVSDAHNVRFAQMNEETRRAFEATAKGVQKSIIETRKPQAKPSRQLRSEWSIRFGHTLVPESQANSTALSIEKGSRLPKTAFSTRLPILSQFLALRRSKSNTIQTTSNLSDGSESRVLRLLFEPEHSTTRFPPLEVFVRPSTTDDGEEQSLKIVQISARLVYRSHLVLLPGYPVDLEVARHLKRDLYVGDQDDAPKSRSATIILDQFKAYLQSVKQGQPLQLSPFLTITDLPTRASLMKRQLKSGEKTGEEGSSETEATTSENRYVLGNAHVLYSTKFQTPTPSPFMLEHVQYDGLGFDRNKEELRLAEYPLEATSRDIQKDDVSHESTKSTKRRRMSDAERTHDSRWFFRFFHAAAEVALRLGDRTLLKQRSRPSPT